MFIMGHINYLSNLLNFIILLICYILFNLSISFLIFFLSNILDDAE